jgi:hypothetical protein
MFPYQSMGTRVGGPTPVVPMSEQSDKTVLWSDPPPRPSPGFEADVMGELEGLVRALPAGTASMLISRLRADARCLEPEFEITPRNPKAARFGGYAVATDLYLTIGEAGREFIGFGRGGKIVRGVPWQEELRWIWQAVIAGGFTQRHYLDSGGKVIAWYSKLIVNGTDLILRNGRREKLFGRAYTSIHDVTYEAYL